MKIDGSWFKKPGSINFPGSEKAGGVIVRQSNSKLLIALLGDRRFLSFSLPKGTVEKGESPLHAAKREIEEELGLSKLNFIRKIGILERYTYKKTSWNRYHYFLFSTDQIKGMQKLTPDEKYLYLKWFDLENIPEFFWPEQKKLVIKVIPLIKALSKESLL